ncbi:hypothetical protein [Niabella drilacis]|uniref:OmpA family protein n=1 Tax=Niabella drilacis (strain DSM 25811 / CCM 8410 / CCUG 62505 / LMG 26954 / E90) TaxID=1285928 RepID=A0A1G6YMZ8_NIADE|nr:hypothetical protein [Niabella drilacis]SDD91700.1 hypothetical protein SAMN04487894_11633 [Niabella drilacis]
MKFCSFILAFLILTSCGMQKRMTAARATSEKTQKMVHEESVKLDSIKKILDVKAADRAVDSVLNRDVLNILEKLGSRLNSAQQLALIMDMATRNKAAFRKGISSADLLKKLIILDSFNTAQKRREVVYRMLTESVSTAKYQLFHYAAFFDPGVYRIPESAIKSIRSHFTPIIDSISRISNKYAGIPREARIVFVGYSDSTPIVKNGQLYKELVRILDTNEPGQRQMNQLLSDLRAKEMVRNMKMVLNDNTGKFKNFNTLKIGYVAYGKGEEYPSPRIDDYKPTDERRRIVLSYWTVLPDLDDL